MTTTQALYVLEVAGCRSISQAARRLYVSQSAISQQIGKLEKELGCTLFARSTYGLELTPEGERFCSKARPVIDAWQRLCREMQGEGPGVTKRLRIGLGSRVWSNSLFGDIVGFFDRHPEIEVSFLTEAGNDPLLALRRRQVDLVLDRLPTEGCLDEQKDLCSLALVRERTEACELSPRPRDLSTLRRAMEQQLHERLLDAVGEGAIESEH